MSLKHDNYIKVRKNVTIFLEKKIKMKLSKIVSCISCVRGHQSRKQSAINKLLPRIKECKRTGVLDLRNLNLNNSDVEEILKYVTKKNITVQKLDLRFNELTTLPDSIGQLQFLEWLDLENNHLTTLPDSIGELQRLELLFLNSNHITTLPDSIGQLQRLVRLYVEHNHLTTLPDSIGQLQFLEWLELRFNELTTLPDSIGQLQDLKGLGLAHNHLTTLPESIGLLQGLGRLGLAHNHLTTLPESIGLLQGLEWLDLMKNYLPIGSIQLYNERVVLIENQKNKDNLIYDFENAQQAKQIIHDKVLYYTGNPLGQLTLEETFNHAVFNSLDQSKVPINIDNKYIYSLIGLLKLEEKYQDELPSIKRQIYHLQKIASERNWEIPDFVAEVAT